MEIGNIKSRKELGVFFNESGFKKGAEIGVDRGLFSEHLHKCIPGLELLSIDPWVQNPACRKLAMNTLAKYPKNKIIQKTSMEAACCVPEQSLDFVYIDGEHTFDAVMCDLIEWSKRVRPGGIVSGHDYIKKLPGLRRAVNVYTHFHRIKWYVTEKQRRGADKYISFYFVKK